MPPRDIDRFFLVTGGPGSGKTTLLDRIKAEGAACIMPEAGRAVIRDQVSIGGKALPWEDRTAFADLMFAADVRSYNEASTRAGPVVFDRGVPDIIGYLNLCQLPVPAHIEAGGARFRYSNEVFIAPPWREIYQADSERKQSFDEALATYDAMVEVYGRLGYKLIELPRVSVKRRMAFVLDIMARAGDAPGFSARS